MNKMLIGCPVLYRAKEGDETWVSEGAVLERYVTGNADLKYAVRLPGAPHVRWVYDIKREPNCLLGKCRDIGVAVQNTRGDRQRAYDQIAKLKHVVAERTTALVSMYKNKVELMEGLKGCVVMVAQRDSEEWVGPYVCEGPDPYGKSLANEKSWDFARPATVLEMNEWEGRVPEVGTEGVLVRLRAEAPWYHIPGRFLCMDPDGDGGWCTENPTEVRQAQYYHGVRRVEKDDPCVGQAEV